MPGPAPKPAQLRARRNSTAVLVTARTLPAAGYAGPIPLLPGQHSLLVETWWRTIWRSPMAVAWAETDTDVFGLARLAALLNEAMLGDPRSSAEARQLEDRFGLSPAGRLRLGWTIEREVDPGTVTPLKSVPGQPPALPPGFDPRKMR